MKPNDPATALGVLLTADEASLERLRAIIDALIATKQRSRLSKPRPASDPPDPNPGLGPSGLHAPLSVAPMRAPRPGSIRADVHHVLSQNGEMSRGDVIREVAKIRRDHQAPHFSTKIGDALNRTNDPRIKKVRRGIFRYLPG